ncbi:MAG: HD domain-containing protein [Oscillospiraceae bacterium]|nr:HD domain-containing protein [Oscillospiraceae bacterium]
MAKTIRQIYDNIYGYIDFDRDLFDGILKDSFFLRLHNLKQMGLAYYVYPDALHTRYAHSVGVYAAVNKIIDAQKYFSDPVSINEQDRYKIMLSALLHDIGHLPLSHTIESALSEFEEFESQDCSTGSTENFSDEFFKEQAFENKMSESGEMIRPSVALHEKLGEFVLNASPISRLLESRGISPYDIAAGFKGNIVEAQQNEIAETSFYDKQIRNFLHSQLDADRIDYLLRDSGFSGVKSGSFDIDKLLSSIIYDRDANYGIDESSIRALEQFFISRFVAYCQIVGNKKVMAFEYMAKDFYLRLLKLRKAQNYHLGIRLYSYRDLKDDILKRRPEEFLHFADDYFFSLIREVLENKDSVEAFDPLVVKYANYIKNVQPLSPVTYYETFEELEDEPCFINFLREHEDWLLEIAELSGVPREEIIIPKPMKVSIYKANEDPIQVFHNRTIIQYKDVSQSPASLLRFLKSKTYIIYRIYTFDKEQAQQLRKVMKEKAKDFKYRGDL